MIFLWPIYEVHLHKREKIESHLAVRAVGPSSPLVARWHGVDHPITRGRYDGHHGFTAYERRSILHTYYLIWSSILSHTFSMYTWLNYIYTPRLVIYIYESSYTLRVEINFHIYTYMRKKITTTHAIIIKLAQEWKIKQLEVSYDRPTGHVLVRTYIYINRPKCMHVWSYIALKKQKNTLLASCYPVSQL